MESGCFMTNFLAVAGFVAFTVVIAFFGTIGYNLARLKRRRDMEEKRAKLLAKTARLRSMAYPELNIFYQLKNLGIQLKDLRDIETISLTEGQLESALKEIEKTLKGMPGADYFAK